MHIEWSFDDGLRQDIIIADLFRKYNMHNVIFYIPNTTALTIEQIKDLSKDFIIGGHTVSHYQDLKLLSDKLLKSEIEDNKKWLEGITGKEITKFCYPRGRWDERVIRAVANAGYLEARTTIVLNTEINDFNKDTTVHFYPRKEYATENKTSFEIARYFILSYREEEVLRFWGHSKELLKFYKLGDLEDLLKFVKENE